MHIIILAGGHGTRMKSAGPKALQTLGGRPLLAHILEAADALSAAGIHVIVAPEAQALFEKRFADANLNWVVQEKPLGTGHAVAQALPAIADDGAVLVLYGDVPMVRAETMRALLDAAGDGGMALLTASPPDPSGLGRILRRGDEVIGIVEDRDADEAERAITEVSVGPMVAPASALRRWLPELDADNAQGEIYLTDVVALARTEGIPVRALKAENFSEVRGLNDPWQLGLAERDFQLRQAEALMRAGVRIADPHRFDLRGELQCGEGVFIDIGVVMSGKLRLGDNVSIGPHCVLEDSEFDSGVRIASHCVVEGAQVGADCHVGPYARLRPGTLLEANARVGNFVEIKKSRIGRGSKISHLSYVGDATLGAEVNIGAGVITCNYDGERKHPTTIGDGAFIGSNASLIAPIDIGAGAVVAASAAISENVPAGALAVERSPQKSVSDWKRRRKKGKSADDDDKR